MDIPMLLLGIVVSSLYGAAFHLLTGGGLGRLLLYLILSWAGFWIGNYLAGRLGWTFGSIGALHLGMATVGSLVFLGIGYWLSLSNKNEKIKNQR